MSLINFLHLDSMPAVREIHPLSKGDLVFSITKDVLEFGLRRWRVLRYCHTGLLAKDVSDYWLGDEVQVYHMTTKRISCDNWSNHTCRIDLVGVVSDLDKSTRSELINKALSYFGRRPARFGSCYWMGEASPNCHPRFPDNENEYGFTCATFVHQCYVDIDMPLVALDSMPLTTNEELEELIAQWGENSETRAFRRLHPGYIIGATMNDTYPFEPDNWDEWKSYSRYIPSHMRTTI